MSDRRAGGAWVLSTPIQQTDRRDQYSGGMTIVSRYRVGQAESQAGSPARVRAFSMPNRTGTCTLPQVAPMAHRSPAPNDDPAVGQYMSEVAPYLRGWERVLGHHRVGVYADSTTIDGALQDGLGSYFWQHNRGSPGRVAYPAARLHQLEVDVHPVVGVGVDVNHILTPNYGQ